MKQETYQIYVLYTYHNILGENIQENHFCKNNFFYNNIILYILTEYLINDTKLYCYT